MWKRGRSSSMEYHGAFESVKTCRAGRMPGSASRVPRVMTTVEGSSSRSIKRCEPHLLQKHFRRWDEDPYPARRSRPRVHWKSAAATSAFAEKAVPWAFLHMEQ